MNNRNLIYKIRYIIAYCFCIPKRNQPKTKNRIEKGKLNTKQKKYDCLAEHSIKKKKK